MYTDEIPSFGCAYTEMEDDSIPCTVYGTKKIEDYLNSNKKIEDYLNSNKNRDQLIIIEYGDKILYFHSSVLRYAF